MAPLSPGFLVAAVCVSEMEVALELREAVVSAVCAKEYDKLPGLVQRLAKLAPTEEILLRSGIGHLVGDRHLWALAGVTTQRRAAALQARWRQAVRQARASGSTTPRASPKPLGGLRAKDFLALVKEFEKALAICLPDAVAAVRRAVAVKAVLMGFSCVEHLADTHEEDIN